MNLNVLSSNKGYIMFEGKVQACEIASIVRSKLVNGDIRREYICRIGGESRTIVNDFPNLYENEQSCANQKGENIVSENEYRHVSFSNVIGCNSVEHVYYWTANGLKKEDVQDCTIVIGYTKKGLVKFTIENLAERIYSSEELASADHSFEVVEQDGSTHTLPSLSELAKLTDTQQAIFDNLINAFKACKDNNIGILIHYWENGISAFNTDSIAEYEYGYKASEDNFVAIDQVLPEAQNYIHAEFWSINDDDSLFARVKKTNK